MNQVVGHMWEREDIHRCCDFVEQVYDYEIWDKLNKLIESFSVT